MCIKETGAQVIVLEAGRNRRRTVFPPQQILTTSLPSFLPSSPPSLLVIEANPSSIKSHLKSPQNQQQCHCRGVVTCWTLNVPVLMTTFPITSELALESGVWCLFRAETLYFSLTNKTFNTAKPWSQSSVKQLLLGCNYLPSITSSAWHGQLYSLNTTFLLPH